MKGMPQPNLDYLSLVLVKRNSLSSLQAPYHAFYLPAWKGNEVQIDLQIYRMYYPMQKQQTGLGKYILVYLRRTLRHQNSAKPTLAAPERNPGKYLFEGSALTLWQELVGLLQNHLVGGWRWLKQTSQSRVK